ncbi:MAG: hypothetical protein AAGI37_06670 [Planctomycetota bacterium]
MILDGFASFLNKALQVGLEKDTIHDPSQHNKRRGKRDDIAHPGDPAAKILKVMIMEELSEWPFDLFIPEVGWPIHRGDPDGHPPGHAEVLCLPGDGLVELDQTLGPPGDGLLVGVFERADMETDIAREVEAAIERGLDVGYN